MPVSCWSCVVSLRLCRARRRVHPPLPPPPPMPSFDMSRNRVHVFLFPVFFVWSYATPLCHNLVVLRSVRGTLVPILCAALIPTPPLHAFVRTSLNLVHVFPFLGCLFSSHAVPFCLYHMYRSYAVPLFLCPVGPMRHPCVYTVLVLCGTLVPFTLPGSHPPPPPHLCAFLR